MKTLLFVAAMMLLPSVTAVSDPQSALKCQVRNKMTPLVFLGLLLSTCDASVPASNNGNESQIFASSTNAIDVARRESACTPQKIGDAYYKTTGTVYMCRRKGYTQVPSTVWIPTTTEIDLGYNAITFIRENAFDGLTLMTYLWLAGNAITLIPVGMVDDNIALEVLHLDDNAITFIPASLVENNPALKTLGFAANAITSVPEGLVDNNPALEYFPLAYNTITSIPASLVENNPALTVLILFGNPLVCSNFGFGTAISSVCTSCTVGTPQSVTCGSAQIDFWQCDSQCVSEPNSETPTVSPTAPSVAPTTSARTPFPTPSPTTTAPTLLPTPSPTTTAPTPNPTPSAEITKATEPPQECPNNCGTVEQGGGTCKADSTGALGCLSCNEDRVLIKGKFNGEFVGICKKTVYCKSRKLFSGGQVGYPCRCIIDSCHYCIQSGTEPEKCKVCRDGAFLLNNECIATCPDDMTSVGISLYKRRCEAPFTCKSGRTPSGDGCKCATNENARAACNKCEFEAGQFGQKCLNCAGSLYLNPENNQCEEECAPFEESGLIPYLVGTYGGQCRKPFTCTSKKDEAKEKCKCDKSLGACEVCDYTAVGPTCKVCGQKKYLDIKNGVCVKKCPADTNPVGDGTTGRECAPQ